MHFTNNRNLRALLLLGAASAVGFSTQALAQNDQSVETVVVTGSMLPRTSLETPAPVTFISVQDIQNSGLTTTTDVLRSVTANSSGSLPNGFGPAFASGASNISLRGLESNSTLVLINGQRTVDYPIADDGVRSFVDLNTIPQHAIDHIEILKDGASSVYGADAVAGVVNIITVDDYQGAEADARAGGAEQGGGQEEYFAGRLGYGSLSTDRFNVYIDAEFEHDNNVKVGQRPYPFNQIVALPGTSANLSLNGLSGPNLQGGPGAVSWAPSYNATVAPALINNFANNFTPPTQLGGTQPISAGFGQTGTCGQGTTLGMNNPGTTSYFAPGGTYCYQNDSLFYDDQPQVDKYNLYAHVTAKLWPGATGKLDVSYDENDVSQRANPPTLQYTTPTNTSELTLPAYLSNGNANPNDPFVFGNPACAQTGQTEATAHSATCPDEMMAYLFPISAGFTSQAHVLRTTLNINGEYEGWTYDINAVAAHAWLYLQEYGFLNLNNELSAINNGTYNFVNPAANSKTLLNTLAPPIDTVNTNDLELIDAHVSREVVDLPGGPLQVGVGATIRHEQSFAPNSNPNLQQGLGIYQIIGSRNVYSNYIEASAPILPSLELDASGRYDHYTDAGDTVNPKLAAKWTPVQQVSLRGTFSTGFVAPSFAQSGPSSEVQGFVAPYTLTSAVPCMAPGPNSSNPFYAAHGDGLCNPNSTNTYINAPYSLGNQTVGNPNIKPEHSRSYTAGAVIQPFLDIDLSATVDYYWISETNLITSASEVAGQAVGDYLTGKPLPAGVTLQFDAPDPLFPNAPPRPINVIGSYTNQNAFKTDGMDVEIKGSTDLPYGVHWSSDLNVTKIFDFWFYSETPGAPVTKEAWVGTMSPTAVNAGGGTPRWSGAWANTFTFDRYTQSFVAYYHSGMFMDLEDVGVFQCAAAVTTNTSCKAKSYFDLDSTSRVQIDDTWEVFLTIKDILGTKPPINAVGGGPLVNDEFDQEALIGRFFLAGVRVKL